uniref:Uncharacterized protein n=1 Tax=Arion vulgaris TaxID=1028688 RepID=A0A0B7AH39_9EUPU
MEDIKNDPRFAHIATDPKFRIMPKSKRKVKIDSRFQSVFTSQHFSHKTDTDKRGRPVLDSSKRNKHVMQRFYDISDDEEAESDTEVADSSHTNRKNKSSSSDLGGKPRDKARQKHKNKQIESYENSKVKDSDGNPKKQSSNSSILLQNGLDISVQEDEDSNKDTSEEDDDDDLPEFTQEFVIDETEIDHKWNEHNEDTPTVVESTHRLAVCNMDWDFVKAQDLFVLFKSFVPSGGCVKSVTIFPSEFGKERMVEEARLGPKEMREHLTNNHANTSVTEDVRRKKKKTVDQQQIKRSTKEQEATNTEKLREYQLNRMKYYFAVIVCDSVPTAEKIYSECDGREYMLSSVRLDLRFIPDDMTFDDVPKEAFSEEQKILEYAPNRFSSTALSQAKVDVTWDETDFDRLSRRVAGLQQKELESIVEENKFAEVIAPPESDSDEDMRDRPDWLEHAIEDGDGEKVFTEEEKITVYRKLLMDSLKEEGEDKDADEKEYVWQPGLKSSLVKQMQRKEKKEAETGVVSEYLEKKKEKKRKKKEKKMITKEDEEVDDEVGVNGDDVSVSKTKESVDGKAGNKLSVNSDNLKRKRKRADVEDRGSKSELNRKADLELLVMGENDAKEENRDEVGSSKKRKKLKKKKLLEAKDDFQLDVSDARFGALYTSHHFHIDPTASQFKKSKNMASLVNEQIKRRGKYGRPELSSVTQSAAAHDDQSKHTETSRSQLQSLVNSLKLKMKK